MTSSPIEKGVGRTKRAWFGRVTSIFGRSSIQPEAWDELEEALIGADVGLDLSEELVSAPVTALRKCAEHSRNISGRRSLKNSWAWR